MVRRLFPGAALALVVLLGAVVPVEASHWPFFGGDGGRSGHQPDDGGVPPLSALWARSNTANVLTSPVTTAGPTGQQRVAFGAGDHRTPEGDIVGGRIHIVTLASGEPVTPPDGIKVSDEPDAFGDGFGSVSFGDTSTADALGQLWVVYNDTNGVAIAQVDEEKGELVQKRPPNPADVNDKLVGWSINSSVLLGPPDPAGGRALFFSAFEDAGLLRETLFKVSISQAGTRQAKIGDITTANGDFNFNDVVSPTLIYLYTNAGNPEPHVALGDCTGKIRFFTVDDLQPIKENAIGADSDCVQAITVPVTASGAPPGAPGSGLDAAPVFYVTTSDADGKGTRVHRLVQTTATTFDKKPNDPVVLPGVAAPGVAVDQTVGPQGLSDGRVYVTTGKNLYALDAKDLTAVVAKLNPGDTLSPNDTGFSQTMALVSGGLVFVSRDNGEELVLDKRTLQPVAADSFRPVETARPEGGATPSLSYGEPALSRRTLVFGSTRGLFAYRLRGALPTGYWLAAADGGVFTFGAAPFAGSASGRSRAPVVAMAAAPGGRGYWLAAADGGVFSFGEARFFGSMADVKLNQPVVGMAATPTGGGYWLVARDGAVFAFGDAHFFGSAAGKPLSAPLVGVATTPTGGGYWLAAADGGVFAYGDARFFGSRGNQQEAGPVVGVAATPTGDGYWLVASDGGVFSFGAARFFGSMAGKRLSQPVVGMAASPSGGGYTLVAGDGGVFNFGDLPFYGSGGRSAVGIALH